MIAAAPVEGLAIAAAQTLDALGVYDGALVSDIYTERSALVWSCGHAHHERALALTCAATELLRRALAAELEGAR